MDNNGSSVDHSRDAMSTGLFLFLFPSFLLNASSRLYDGGSILEFRPVDSLPIFGKPFADANRLAPTEWTSVTDARSFARGGAPVKRQRRFRDYFLDKWRMKSLVKWWF